MAIFIARLSELDGHFYCEVVVNPIFIELFCMHCEVFTGVLQ